MANIGICDLEPDIVNVSSLGVLMRLWEEVSMFVSTQVILADEVLPRQVYLALFGRAIHHTICFSLHGYMSVMISHYNLSFSL